MPQIAKNALDSRDEGIRNSGGTAPQPAEEDNLPSVYIYIPSVYIYILGVSVRGKLASSIK